MKSEQSQPAFIGICQGQRCGDYGGAELLAALAGQGIPVARLECQSLCPHAPVVRLPDRCLLHATLPEVVAAIGIQGTDR
ncbi:MAG: hypothetical protein R8L58_07930 [Mariprofundaceae bacterium]